MHTRAIFVVTSLALACSETPTDTSTGTASDTVPTGTDNGGQVDAPTTDVPTTDVATSDCTTDGDCPNTGLAACQVPRCNAGRCEAAPAADSTSCDDGAGCTTGDQCSAGACAGVAVVCPDAKACESVGVCDPATGECPVSALADGSACDDKDACTTVDTCFGGSCLGSKPVECAVSTCREAGTCDPATGACSGAPKADGVQCDDDNACTTGEACAAGECAGGALKECAGGPCAAGGTCDPTTGQCGGTQPPDGTSCDDGDACTEGDACAGGACGAGKPVTCATGACIASVTCVPETGCVPTLADDGTVCDDGDDCTTGEACAGGQCVGSKPVECPPAGACRGAGTCDPDIGACTSDPLPDGTGCDDQDACTTGDECSAGSCAGTAVGCPGATACQEASVCNPTTGDCQAEDKQDGTGCDDGDGCTTGDACASGVCAGESAECEDAGACHAPAVCDPSTGTCSAALLEDGTSCDDGAACTTADKCAAGSCSGTPVVCEPKNGCHDAGTCETSTGACTPNPKDDGATCDDGNPCTTDDSCASGECVGKPVVCSALNDCHGAGICDPHTGVCSNPAKDDGATCSDANPCTTGDICTSGVCAGAAVVCAAQDDCHLAGVCDPTSGACSNPAKNDGATCDDGLVCTTSDRCTAGACGGSPVVCTALDQCHDIGSCDPSTGACTNPSKGNGTVCSDGDACTTTDTCQAGTCVGSSPVVCAALGVCHQIGTCSPATGVCSNPVKAPGTGCDDGLACTHSDVCNAGVCAGVDKVCTAADECHDGGTCNPATGQCSGPPKEDGTPCDDHNLCTTDNTCVAGVCTGEVVQCEALDICHAAGTCDPLTGHCSNPPANEGGACSDGDKCTVGDVCTSGICAGQAPACMPTQQCRMTGSCDPINGGCSFPVSPDGASCDDGDPCTVGDSCASGVCQGTPKVCVASDSCHSAGICNPDTGVCTNPLKDNGTSCDDGSLCTTGDKCFGGACVGDEKICTALDACHSVGVCQPQTGECTHPSKANGTQCDDSNGCTLDDACTNGVCAGPTPKDCGAPDQCDALVECLAPSGTCQRTPKVGTPCDDGDACTTDDRCGPNGCRGEAKVCTAKDSCHSAGVCNPSTGVCSDPPVADGTFCDDGDTCSVSDACEAGICRPGSPLPCPSTNDCNLEGTCQPLTGECVNPPVLDGILCNDENPCTQVDTCSAGVCTGADPVTCSTDNPCSNPGTCDPLTGECGDTTPKGNGTLCNDGDACTSEDTCVDGGCAGVTSVVCPADGCSTSICDPGTGTCVVNGQLGDGASCEDGQKCTSNDTCQSGSCVAGEPVHCPPTNQCQDVGTCNTETGSCVYTNRPNGSSCNDFAACTESDTCQAGMCSTASCSAPPLPVTGLIITEFRVRGPSGGNDEFVEITNTSLKTIVVGGMELWGSAASSTSGFLRVAIPAGRTLAPGASFLFTNTGASGFSGPGGPGNVNYTTGFVDAGGIALLSAGAVLDQVGLGTTTFYKEGTPLTSLGTVNSTEGFRRKLVNGVFQDTGNNAADFEKVTTSPDNNSWSPASPPGLFFGGVVNKKTSLATGITNLLNVTLNVTSAEIVGGPLGVFVTTQPSPLAVPAGMSSSVFVTFEPPSIGNFSAQLKIVTPNGDTFVPLIGVAAP